MGIVMLVIIGITVVAGIAAFAGISRNARQYPRTVHGGHRYDTANDVGLWAAGGSGGWGGDGGSCGGDGGGGGGSC